MSGADLFKAYASDAKKGGRSYHSGAGEEEATSKAGAAEEAGGAAAQEHHARVRIEGTRGPHAAFTSHIASKQHTAGRHTMRRERAAHIARCLLRGPRQTC